MITGKTIGDLNLLGTITPDTLIPVELNEVTYHVMYSAMTLNSSTNIIYSGKKIDCLNINSGMSITQVVESIGDTFCSEPPIFTCGDVVLRTNPIGECQNPLQYLFNQSILSWCEEHPPVVPCTSNVNSLEYLFAQVIENWNNEHPPVVPCTSNVNPLGYLFAQSVENWNNEHPPVVPCTSNVNPLGNFFESVIYYWENQEELG